MYYVISILALRVLINDSRVPIIDTYNIIYTRLQVYNYWNLVYYAKYNITHFIKWLIYFKC